MQASQKSVLISFFVVTAVLLIAGIFAVSSINSNLALVGQSLSNMPTAEAISAAVLAGIVIPDMPEYDTEKIDELWDEIYVGRIEKLEDDSYIESVYQFLIDNGWEEKIEVTLNDDGNPAVIEYEIDDLFDHMESLEIDDPYYHTLFFEEGHELFDFLEDEYEDIESVQFIKEYEDDREVNVINLGLDDEDDREIELSGVIKVRVIYEGGDETERVKVYISSVVTSDDGDLEAEITYSL